ncbi:hypothetical protein SAMN04489761_2236 [Tenacibaculum sp. MAR_2009_124]|uniref:DUF917 domain-containing protein n=1 Tax=Tenacibaculum sp. MAR_2009_124 TaxID=1250059 RepID=UPI000899B9F9|nr:DUF917 domain-containing protein [Tenacibaculum sp. MAR_2009_124]SEC00820.1 hypothetical protein SAMN04489761_2236 [Tenacibaculum sp. MAR_2009_124]
MRHINENDIDAIALGSTVLGTGGGGDPYIGKLLAKEAIKKNGNVTLIAPNELADDALVLPIAAFGAPMILVEKLFSGKEFLEAFKMMESYLGKKIDAVMPAEAGGLNGVIPFSIAAEHQIPLVDADGMGRAFPRLEMTTFTLHNIPVSPITQADEKGNKNVYHTINNTWGETLVGATTIQMGGSCAIGCYPMTGKQVKQASVHGIVSYAQKLGSTIINAKNERKNPLEALIKEADAIQLFSGKISNVSIKTEGRWNKGICEITGIEKDHGSMMSLEFQNEFLIAKKDNKPVAITPDLIVLIDAENAHPITAETIQYGTRVIVIGMKADAQWRTPEGIVLGGPQKFGYEEKFVPIEILNKID